MERSLPAPWCNGLMDTSNRTRPMFAAPPPCVLAHPLASHILTGSLSGIAIMCHSLPWVIEENLAKHRVARPEFCSSSFHQAPQVALFCDLPPSSLSHLG
ncbi:hypothetical protein NW759_001087 [Fusarium solani]|nr:hypothetical protein NW759_001087 [Fusarium solani]